MTPPITKRFCLACQKITVFKYNRNVGHSRCKECNGYQARMPTLDDEIVRLSEKIKKLKITIEGLRATLRKERGDKK